MFELRLTPANVSAQAAQKLPRWALWAVLILFMLPALLSRDIWTVREAAAFGEMMEMSQGNFLSWLLPTSSEVYVVDHGPLATWLGALFIKLFGGWISPIVASRLTATIWFAIATAGIWYGTWYLARRREAQPVAQVFGVAASYRDYGRLISDAATLFFVSICGLAVRHHEATYETAELALVAMAYFGCTWSMSRPYWGAMIAGLASGAVMLAASLLSGVTVLLAACLSQLVVHVRGRTDTKITIAVGTALITFSLWPFSALLLAGDNATDYFLLWAQAQANAFGIFNQSEIVWFLQHVLWYLCPVLPFAIAGVWLWRHQLDTPMLSMPLAFVAAWAIGFLISDSLSAEDLFAILIPALCTLAAFGLIAVRRSWRSMLDCFAITSFCLMLFLLWAYWIAWQIGVPVKMYESAARLAPSLAPSAVLQWPVGGAVLATLVWIYFSYQRLRAHPKVLWTGPWLGAVGMTCLWCVVIGLFSTAVDANRSYRSVAQDLRKELTTMNFIPGVDCVYTGSMPAGVSAVLGYYGQLNVTRVEPSVCRYEITRTTAKALGSAPLPRAYKRESQTQERFVALKRSPFM